MQYVCADGLNNTPARYAYPFGPPSMVIPSCFGGTDCRGDYTAHLVKIKHILDFRNKGAYEILVHRTFNLMREKNLLLSKHFAQTLKDTIEQYANDYSEFYSEEFLETLPESWARGLQIYIRKRTLNLGMYPEEKQLEIIEEELLTGKKKR